DDRAHALVAAVAAPEPRADRAERQVDVVVDEDEVGRSGADALERPGDDGTAHVHERERLDEVDRLAPPPAPSHESLALAPPRAPPRPWAAPPWRPPALAGSRSGRPRGRGAGRRSARRRSSGPSRRHRCARGWRSASTRPRARGPRC